MQSGRGPSLKPDHTGTLISEFLPSKLLKINLCCLFSSWSMVFCDSSPGGPKQMLTLPECLVVSLSPSTGMLGGGRKEEEGICALRCNSLPKGKNDNVTTSLQKLKSISLNFKVMPTGRAARYLWRVEVMWWKELSMQALIGIHTLPLGPISESDVRKVILKKTASRLPWWSSG